MNGEQWSKAELIEHLKADPRQHTIPEWSKLSGWSTSVVQRLRAQVLEDTIPVADRKVYPLRIGSMRWRVLTYAVSEPGEWTTGAIAEDMCAPELTPRIRRAASLLRERRYLHPHDPKRPGLRPTAAGFDFLKGAQ